jgi:long-chain acyl-CoA synthetase
MTATGALSRDALRQTTAPALLCARSRRTPDEIALRSKHLGIYRERTFRDYATLVSRTARGLAALGLCKGERVAIMGDVCEQWLICDLAAQSLGAVVYGIYPTASLAEVEYQMRDGGASIFIAEDQEHVDKLLPLVDRLPAVRAIVVIDASAMFAYEHPLLTSYDALLGSHQPDLDWLEAQAAQVEPQDPAFIVYTSGTTGNPKGALVAHGKHLAAAATLAEHYPTLNARAHRTVVYLPLSHVLGRDVAVTLPLLTRLVPHFGEDPEDLAATLFEVAPTVLFTVPRYLQKFASQVLVGIMNSSPAKRGAYALAMRFARAHVRRRWEGDATLAQRATARAWHASVFRPILNKLGFDRLELVVSGGAPLPAETMALWHMYGVNVVEIYGQTEGAGGIIAGQRGPFPRPGTVGTVPDGWDVKLDGDGEVLVRSADLFEGYWNDAVATAALWTADGYWRTGDVGDWREGELKLIDRARDFVVTAGGKTIAPSGIENLLRASPYIAEAVVFGHGRKYIAALIEIDPDTVADWARSRDVVYTGFTSLAESPRVCDLIAEEIAKANAQLSRVAQVKTFRILPKALDPEEENEPVTPTRKVKRALMHERFKALVESMYDEREARLLADEVGGALGS